MMRLAFATVALVAISNGIAIKEDDAPVDLPEIQSETQPVELVRPQDKMNSTRFNALLKLAKDKGLMPEDKELKKMSQKQQAMLLLAKNEKKEFLR